jgi:hypothetical protein
MTEATRRGVAAGMGNITILMEREKVARLVAPYVNSYLGAMT